jgi:hypothetical protein
MTDRHIHSSKTDGSNRPPVPRALAVGRALPAWITPDLIDETIRVWQPYYATRLTAEDAVTMILNVGRLLDVLSRS